MTKRQPKAIPHPIAAPTWCLKVQRQSLLPRSCCLVVRKVIDWHHNLHYAKGTNHLLTKIGSREKKIGFYRWRSSISLNGNFELFKFQVFKEFSGNMKIWFYAKNHEPLFTQNPDKKHFIIHQYMVVECPYGWVIVKLLLRFILLIGMKYEL